MIDFVYEALPARIVMRPGALDALPEEVGRLGISRALLVCTPSKRAVTDHLAARLGERAVGVFDRTVAHVPVEMANTACAEAKRLEADGCVAIGGGSAIGFGKAIALELGLPVLAVPTTYAGSEVTPVLGMTEAGVKTTRRDPRLLPRTVIYDPELTRSLPGSLSATSGVNAIAHAVEGLYAEAANPITSIMAEESIRALARALPIVVREPDDLPARADAFYGAWLAGTVLGSVGMALHHKLCHVLGGSFNLGHAEVHTIILPHVAAYNTSAAPDAMARIARALGTVDAAAGLFDLALGVRAEMRLAKIGMAGTDLDRAADLAVRDPYYNPAPVTRATVRALLEDAYHGRRPRARANDGEGASR
jgi:maleylacetate reductase